MSEQTKAAAIDAAHLQGQRDWSLQTFGPGDRLHGVLDHIRKELKEIEDDPTDVTEWVDVIILAFDGAWRAGWEPQQIIDAIKDKQARNEARTWPDWRTAAPDKAIEHLAEGVPMTSVPPTQPPAAPESDVRLTEAEREAWDVDPDLWPHTPPLHIFRALMDEDDNVWWRASGGHGLNAYDAATERIDELEERVRVVEGERDAARAEADEMSGWIEEHALVKTLARAESAEAAHEALRKGIEALADRPVGYDYGSPFVYCDDLRALAGGAS